MKTSYLPSCNTQEYSALQFKHTPLLSTLPKNISTLNGHSTAIDGQHYLSHYKVEISFSADRKVSHYQDRPLDSKTLSDRLMQLQKAAYDDWVAKGKVLEKIILEILEEKHWLLAFHVTNKAVHEFKILFQGCSSIQKPLIEAEYAKEILEAFFPKIPKAMLTLDILSYTIDIFLKTNSPISEIIENAAIQYYQKSISQGIEDHDYYVKLIEMMINLSISFANRSNEQKAEWIITKVLQRDLEQFYACVRMALNEFEKNSSVLETQWYNKCKEYEVYQENQESIDFYFYIDKMNMLINIKHNYEKAWSLFESMENKFPTFTLGDNKNNIDLDDCFLNLYLFYGKQDSPENIEAYERIQHFIDRITG